MQELLTAIRLKKYVETNEQAWEAYDYVVDIAKSLLEKEKDVMCDFVEYCDEANRNYQQTEESWCEDFTIDDMFDKRFNTDVTNL